MKKTILLIIVAMAACGKQESLESFGLEVISIRMQSSDLSQMNSSYNDKKSFPAVIVHGEWEETARVSYAGRTTLDAWKKSWDIHINGKTWRLAATPDDPTMLRSVAGYKLFSMAGFPVPEVSHVFVYLNDEPAGLFLRKELISDDFFRERGISVRSVYKAHYNDKRVDERAITLMPEFFSAKFHRNPSGQEKNWSDLRSLVREMVYTPDSVNHIDQDSLMRYHAATVALTNWDGFSNNYFLYSEEEKPAIFRFQPWDLDRAFEAETTVIGITGNDFWGRYISGDDSRVGAYRKILASTVSLMESAEFKDHINKQAALIEDAWTSDRALSAGKGNFAEAHSGLIRKISERAEFLRSLIPDENGL